MAAFTDHIWICYVCTVVWTTYFVLLGSILDFFQTTFIIYFSILLGELLPHYLPFSKFSWLLHNRWYYLLHIISWLCEHMSCISTSETALTPWGSMNSSGRGCLLYSARLCLPPNSYVEVLVWWYLEVGLWEVIRSWTWSLWWGLVSL